MSDWEFAHIEFLVALAVIPLLVLWYVFKYWNRQAIVGYSTSQFFQGKTGWKSKIHHALFVLRVLAISAIIVALARPQSSSSWQDIKTEGIDIVIAFDISSSMLARDFEPNRLEAAKEVAIEFIKNRPNDRIGLVVYSGESFTQCPLTTDHDKLINLFEQLENGMVTDGTAIGMGLANAVNRLKESTSKSKVVILLTDGESNMGSIPPITAAEIATTFGVKVYTIGVGTKGQAPMPVSDMFGRIRYQNMDVNIDEETLTQIAELTNGQYFRATNNESLESIYAEIDKLEKTVIEETQYEKKYEEFFSLALIALGLLLAELILRRTIFKSATSHV
ncbi:VWA domain-containing protein [Salibacteraceae bacterium]|jgi:Ca-activated chloride channel homolog|nr:VWA domain-containing protein [Salibacteraceae bacterium]MDB4105300.1 VWA domain-containing protein [Salibacteraceae bacterium]MDB9708952.1 VWA domain-containing protein [Salibacteraceae bacterium]HAQ71950.1 aerotolerance regulator BatA [Flavobacteriales bacterium]